MTATILGFDVGGTKCAVILGGLASAGAIIVARREWPTRTERGPDAIVADLIATAQDLMRAHAIAAGRVASIGISCGGPLDRERGIVLGPPNLPGWDHVAICERLSAAFHAPAHLENDANAGAVAEWRWGAGRGCSSLIFLTCGTGMGAGLIVDGRLHAGAGGLAGEVGHLRLAEHGPYGHGKNGSFEGFCSGGGIARAARAAAQSAWSAGARVAYCANAAELEAVSARSVAEAARAGDAVARTVYDEAGRRLGQGLALLIDVLAPEAIVIGGIFARSRDLLWPQAERVLAAEALPRMRALCRVAPAELGDAIGDYAAIAAAPLAAAGATA
jgi:glucokinase